MTGRDFRPCTHLREDAMIIFDGIYRWPDPNRGHERPITWWPSAYHLRIIDVSRNRSGLFLRPVIVVVTDTGEGGSAANYAQYLIKQVCRDFDLDIHRLMWVELTQGSPPRMEVATFREVTRVGGDPFYAIDWRPIHTNELAVLGEFIPETVTLG